MDYVFVGLPDSVPAGSRLTVANHAEPELHELVVFKLADDERRAAAGLTVMLGCTQPESGSRLVAGDTRPHPVWDGVTVSFVG